jgi:hypothetical protein
MASERGLLPASTSSRSKQRLALAAGAGLLLLGALTWSLLEQGAPPAPKVVAAPAPEAAHAAPPPVAPTPSAVEPAPAEPPAQAAKPPSVAVAPIEPSGDRGEAQAAPAEPVGAEATLREKKPEQARAESQPPAGRSSANTSVALPAPPRREAGPPLDKTGKAATPAPAKPKPKNVNPFDER